MNKTLKLAILALATTFTAMAAPVSQQRACDIAKTYLAAQNGAPANISVNGVEKLDQMYLINFAPRGFVLVSNDDNAEPIMGYSTESNLHYYQMPDNMQNFLDQAAEIIKLQGYHGRLNSKWTTIESGAASARSRAGGEPVEPLIKVEWNQSSPYNYYCPGEGNNKAIVGCVAVAMSQAMSVQQYPERPLGAAAYAAANYGLLSIDYDKEQPYNWKDIISGANNKREVARLLYHAGVSVNMDYGHDGSGIPSNEVYRITNALKSHFGYGSNVNYYWRKDYRGDWSELLLNELYAGNALVYNAIDTKGNYGHSFNIDGYNGMLFHVNWGWGGYGNGYFPIDALADAAMGMNYDAGHVVVTGIGGMNSSLHGIRLPDTYVEENMPAGTIVSAVLINNELPSSTMKVEVTGPYNASLGYESTPFEYKNGAIVTTAPLTCSDSPKQIRVVITNSADNSRLAQTFNIEIVKPQTIEHRTSVIYDRASDKFTVHTKYNASYKVTDASGNVITSGTVGTIPEFEFRRSQLSDGNNTMTITIGGQSANVTIAK